MCFFLSPPKIEALSGTSRVSFIGVDEPGSVIKSYSLSPGVCTQSGSRGRLISRLQEGKVTATATPSRDEFVGTTTTKKQKAPHLSRFPPSSSVQIWRGRYFQKAPRFIAEARIWFWIWFWICHLPAVSASAVVGVYLLTQQRG